jgi:hypothetical protein
VQRLSCTHASSDLSLVRVRLTICRLPSVITSSWPSLSSTYLVTQPVKSCPKLKIFGGALRERDWKKFRHTVSTFFSSSRPNCNPVPLGVDGMQYDTILVTQDADGDVYGCGARDVHHITCTHVSNHITDAFTYRPQHSVYVVAQTEIIAPPEVLQWSAS